MNGWKEYDGLLLRLPLGQRYSTKSSSPTKHEYKLWQTGTGWTTGQVRINSGVGSLEHMRTSKDSGRASGQRLTDGIAMMNVVVVVLFQFI